MIKCWMRKIKIELISEISNNKLVFGNKEDNFKISISGEKNPAILSDKGVVRIYNLPYSMICKIMYEKFYKIKIWIGYEGSNFVQLYDGSVALITNKLHNGHDWECYIAFASDLVAKYSQNRMNFALNSSVNLYTALEEILYGAGIKDYNIDDELKSIVLTETYNAYGSAATILQSQTLCQDGNYEISTDGIGTVIDVTTTKGKRVIDLNEKNIPIGGGNPRISSEGLQIVLLPFFDFKVGDILHINNAIVDISSSSSNASNVFNANYMDKNGMYMIQKMTYQFENRDNAFSYNVTARALDIISQFDTESEE